MTRALVILAILYGGMNYLPSLMGTLPMENPVFTTAVLGFIMLASLTFGQLAARAGFPLITGYLVAGMLFGPYVLQLFHGGHVERLSFINDIALALIALNAGAELEWASIKKRFLHIGLLSLLQVGMVGLLVFGLFLAALRAGLFPDVAPPETALYAAILLAVIATANSPSSVVAVVNELKARGPISSMVLGVSVIKDILVIGMFAVAMSAVAGLKNGGTELKALHVFADIATEAALSLGAGAAVGSLVIVYLKVLRRELLLFTMALAVLCASMASLFHLNDLLLAIAVGFVVRNLQKEGELFMEYLEKGSMPVFVVFFTLAGASLNLKALSQMWLAATVLVLARGVAMWFSSYVYAAIGKEGVMMKKHLWSGFVPQAGVSLGFAVLVSDRFGAWGDGVGTLVIAAVAVNQLVGPVLFKFSLAASGEAAENDYNGKKTVKEPS